jgi:hypothetical protein
MVSYLLVSCCPLSQKILLSAKHDFYLRKSITYIILRATQRTGGVHKGRGMRVLKIVVIVIVVYWGGGLGKVEVGKWRNRM